MGLSLPKQPSEDIMKSLIRAGQFLEHARSHAYSEGEFDSMIAIHNLDNAVEYMLRIIIRHLEIEENTGKSIITCELAQLIGEISKYLKDKGGPALSCVQELKLIRELRNMVQHAMINPAADIKTYLNYAEKFFDKSLEKYFGISRAELQYSTLIKDEDLKAILKDAEEKIEGKKYLEAIVSARNLFECSKFRYLSDYRNQLWSAPTFAELRVNNYNLYQLLTNMNEAINVGILGLDTIKYQRFCNYCDFIPAQYCSDWRGNTVLQREWNKEDAVFCYSFVANAVLTWQSRYIKPIQTLDTSGLPSITMIEKIEDIQINTVYPEKGCIYGLGEEFARMFFVDSKEDEKSLMAAFKQGRVSMHTETIINGKSNVIEKKVDILGYDSRIIMNKPATWELIVLYKNNDSEAGEV